VSPPPPRQASCQTRHAWNCEHTPFHLSRSDCSAGDHTKSPTSTIRTHTLPLRNSIIRNTNMKRYETILPLLAILFLFI
jgi:hypothetical protein